MDKKLIESVRNPAIICIIGQRNLLLSSLLNSVDLASDKKEEISVTYYTCFLKHGNEFDTKQNLQTHPQISYLATRKSINLIKI